MAAFWRVLRWSMFLLDPSGKLDGPVVVAVAVVHVVEMAVDEIIDVVAVGDGLMAAAFAMDMAGFVTGARVAAGAVGGVGGGNFECVFVEVAFVRMVQVTVVKVIDVAFMGDRRVAATRAVDVIVILVYVMVHLSAFPLAGRLSVECARALKIKPATCWSARE